LLFLDALHSLKDSSADPKSQYGITKVIKNIISQKPIVITDRKAKKPRY
tara:strand:- start:114 stop:260 length:147 start_codon:yes stop_codon:yes gene_type:complete